MMKFWLAGVIAAALTVSMVAFSDGGTSTVYADPDVGACGNDFIDVPDTVPLCWPLNVPSRKVTWAPLT